MAMLNKKILIIFSVFLGLSIISLPGYSAEPATMQMDIPQTQYQMSRPSEWIAGGVSGENVLASFKSNQGFYPNLNIFLEDHPNKTPEQVFLSLKSKLPSPSVLKAETIDVNGVSVHLSDVSWSSILGSLRALRVITKHNQKMLIITFVGKKEVLSDEEKKFFEACLMSLHKK
jgi:hypothetical protein